MNVITLNQPDMKRRVGIMGGTFDPPHYAHLFMGMEALHQFSLERVIFIPANVPPHKREEMVPALHRLRMISLAVKDEERFEVSDLEIKRGEISYTVETLRELRSWYGENAELYFLAGSDSAIELPTWRSPEEILKLCKFVVFERPGYPISHIREDIKKEIIVANSLHLEISSSEIRERIREGKPIRYLLPPSVEEYIWKNGLYR